MLKFITKNSFLIMACLLSSNIAISMEDQSIKKQKTTIESKYNICKDDAGLEKRILKNVEISTEINLEKICRETSLILLSAYHVAKNNCELPESIDQNTLELVQFIKDMLNARYKDQEAVDCIIKLAGQYFFSSPRNYKPEIELINRALNEAIMANHQKAVDIILILQNKISVNKLDIQKLCQNKDLVLLSAYNIAKSHNLNIDNLNLPNELKDLVSFIRAILNSNYKDYKAVECIIKLKTDSEYKPSQKLLDRTLLEASIACDASAIKLLIAKGANPNIKIKFRQIEDEEYRYTPLRCTRSITVAEILLENGANADANHPNDEFNVDTTPLMDAIEDNNIELVKLLLKYGADVNAFNSDYGDYVINYAFDYASAELLELIVNNKDVANFISDHGEETYLIYAARNVLYANPKKQGLNIVKRTLEVAKILIKNASAEVINHKDDKDKTALTHAVESGNFEIVKLFLEYNADIFIKNNKGKTALDIAQEKYEEAIKSQDFINCLVFKAIFIILKQKETEIFQNMPKLVPDETKTRESDENYLSRLRTANSYEILEIQPDASQREIKEAFNRLSREWHPDRNQSPYSAEIFRLIHTAYKRLKSEK